jgi:hypothetical protein
VLLLIDRVNDLEGNNDVRGNPNVAMLKQLDKFYTNKVDVQWVQLIWTKYYSSIVPHLVRENGFF